MANYRPISNLTFLSKVIERIVAKQLNDYLAANNLLTANQSAYNRFYSAGTTTLQVLSDVVMSADAQKVTAYSTFLLRSTASLTSLLTRGWVQPFVPKSSQDTDPVARIEASGQWHCSHAGTSPDVITHCGWLSAWPWCGYWQLSHDGGSRFGHLSVWLLSTAPAVSCRPILHSRRSQDDCACFHCM